VQCIDATFVGSSLQNNKLVHKASGMDAVQGHIEDMEYEIFYNYADIF
jgi:hypothetical protein